jgi:large subunit ribosomal protein L24
MANVKLHVRRDDNVLILTGKDKGKKGKVLKAYPEDGRVVVEGCNIVTRHTKPRGQQKKGGRLKQESPINSSNVMIICGKCHKATRIAHEINQNGDKKRICKKCGATLD